MGKVGIWLGLGSLILAITLGLGIATTSAHDTGMPHSHPTAPADSATVIKATFLSVDPARGEVEARLEFFPPTDLLSEDVLNTPLTLQVNSVDKAGSLFQFPQNRPMDAIVVRFPILAGALVDILTGLKPQ